MNYEEVKEALKLGYKANIAIMLWGHHGMGKSTAVKTAAQEMQIGFIDLRCAQLEATDLRGFPAKEDGKTVYYPPKELPTEGKGILFLDEFNRADDPVHQAAMQLIIEHKIGTYELPEGWMVVAAGNYGDGYKVNDLCPALISRFCHLELTKSEEYISDWSRHLLQKHGDAATKVIQFIGSDFDNLCSRKNETLGFQLEPSARLWESLIKVNQVASGFNQKVVSDVRKGLIGADLANQYERANFDIQPYDVVNQGVKVLEGKKIAVDQLKGLVWGVVAYLKATHLQKSGNKETWKIDNKRCSNVFDFTEYLIDSKNADLVIVIMTQLLKSEFEKASATVAIIANPNLAAVLNSASASPWIKLLPSRERIYKLTAEIRGE